jgi:hypothetical protein
VDPATSGPLCLPCAVPQGAPSSASPSGLPR